MITHSDSIKIFSGSASMDFANEVARHSGTSLGKVDLRQFSDGEFEPSYEETVRGAHVFIIQSTIPPADNLMELLLMIDAARRASAYKIIAVIPYFGFARQDRKDKPRCSIGSKLVANLLVTAGVSRVITLDLHADQIQGFFDVPVDHLYASSLFIPFIVSLNLDNLVIAAPDMGGTKRANAYAKALKSGLVIGHKVRKEVNKVEEMALIGEVSGKNVIILDDMIDTAGTLKLAAEIIKAKGAKSIRAIATHAVLSGDAYKNIDNSPLDEVIITDSVPLKGHSDKITVLSIAPVFADVIIKITNCESISSNFII
ncbi:MAG: ribose-phosphate pyrophosphokinase [Bacteroidia bacterium]|nr:ribose-phosphate pyrophosphokinase [Bacteroidia bacterium]